MFKKIKHIHFVGIGGSGMSGIAEVLLKLGYDVSGSDMARNNEAIRLGGLGASVFQGHRASNIAGADVVVTSTAIAKNNVEVGAAQKAGIPVIPRIEMLAEIARLKYTIAIAGTHGKTTTTSLVGQILKHAGLDPTVVVGGRLKAVGTGGILGNGDFLVAEADESDGSFLKLSPTIAVVTNIDSDHLDYYKTMDRLREAFVTFASRIPFYGSCYLCEEDPGVRKILPRLTRRTAVYGFNKACDLRASNMVLSEAGSAFDVVLKGKRIGAVKLPLAGRHNVLNALAAIAVGLHIDVPFEKIAAALSDFSGVGRRIEIKGDANGAIVVDDYGHHPTEIRATLAAVRARWPKRRLVVLFQPHRYTRTHLLYKDFGRALRAADKLFLLPIYPAGEKPIRGVSTQLIAKSIGKKNWTMGDGDAAFEFLASELRADDVLLTLGAGDVWKLGEQFIKRCNSLARRLSAAFPELAARVKAEEPLSRHCTWAIGGPAEAYVELRTLRELKDVQSFCRREKIPMFLLGWGSNVLLPDEGLRGCVIRLRGNFEAIEFNGSVVRVGGGVHLPKLAKACADRGLEGVEALAGIPGTIGGALMSNAGTPRGDIGSVVTSVDVLNPDGTLTTLSGNDIQLSYRRSNLPGRWVTGASLSLSPGTNGTPRTDDSNDGTGHVPSDNWNYASGTALERIKWELANREKTQPLGTKNVGSVFRNPPNDFAARLIEAAGLKGKQLGRVRVSPKHANFIENTGGATAVEALALIELARASVREKFGVALELEAIVVKQPAPVGA